MLVPPDDHPDPAASGDALKLSPEMASFRALVLVFVTSYIQTWGQSPSYGEIAAGTNSNRTRVKRAVVSLERKGLLLRAGGVRGLSLPDEIAQARLTLERAGLLPDGCVDRSEGPQARPGARSCPGASPERSEDGGAEAPPLTNSVTKPTLLPVAALDYPAARDRATRGKRRNGNPDNHT